MKVVIVVVLALAVAGPAGAGPERPVARSFAPPDAPPGTPPPTGPGIERETELDEVDAEPDLPQTHLIYFVPKDRPDEDLDGNGTIARSVDSIRAWFAAQTQHDGLPARRPRIDRVPGSGAYDVTFVRGYQEAAAYTALSVITDELLLRGYNAPNKRYLIYAAINRDNICGEGYFPLPIEDSGRYAAVYLDSARCSGRDFGGGTAASAGKTETIAAHEWLHNEGVAAPAVPHHCAVSAYHICTGPLALLPGDLDPEAPDIAFPYINLKLGQKLLDRDRDDYFDHVWPHLANIRNSPWLE